jgi:aryl carrier-like protein
MYTTDSTCLDDALHFLALPSLTLSKAGKVDRTYLQATCAASTPSELAGSLTETESEPLSLIEEVMYGFWSQILNLQGGEPFTSTSSFFQLGEDSISAMKLTTAARELGFILSVDDIFKHPCLSIMTLMLCAQTVDEKIL